MKYKFWERSSEEEERKRRQRRKEKKKKDIGWSCLVLSVAKYFLYWLSFVEGSTWRSLASQYSASQQDVLTGHFYFEFLLNALENFVLGSRGFVTKQNSKAKSLSAINPTDKCQSFPLKVLVMLLSWRASGILSLLVEKKPDSLSLTRTVCIVKYCSTR